MFARGHLVRFPLNLKEAFNLAGHVAFTRSTSANEPVDAWARRHLGESGTEYLLTPFVRGIYRVWLFIGGVGMEEGMAKALEDRLGIKVTVPHDCEYVCAIDAALLGLKGPEARADN